MSAEQSLGEGRLDDCLARLQEQIRQDPAAVKHRVFLFQLLAVLGQWERSLKQLNLAGEMDASTLAMVQTYREALKCESLRAEVFAGTISPLLFGEPAEWAALLIEALKGTASGRHDAAADLRERAFELAPTSGGTINGEPFEWIADADQRLGPMLEVIVAGRYWWVPFERIGSISIEPPEDLRDMVWTPAQLTWSNGGQAVGLIPTRYPGSEAADDDRLRLARMTEWTELGPDSYGGLGQRTLATDQAEYPLLEVREIRFAAAAPADG